MLDFVDIALKYLPYVARGAIVTIELTAMALLLGAVLGLLGAIAKQSGSRPLVFVANVYVEVIRGTPALLQIYVMYFGLATYGLRLDPLTAAALTLGIIGGAYITEIIRAGIEAVDRGQVEAATSLGMAPSAIMRRIVLPQAVVLMVPPFTNFLIALIKDTSLALTISVPEIMYRSYDVASQTYRSMEIYAVAGMIYPAMCYPLSLLAKRLERRRAPR
jgi:His/Glu/Gln/Arg/opine family amino acid ABC transporter permease subunit